MDSCVHNIDVKMVNGVMVSYCTKCGKILNQQNSQFPQPTCEGQMTWGFTSDGSKQILHD